MSFPSRTVGTHLRGLVVAGSRKFHFGSIVQACDRFAIRPYVQYLDRTGSI